MRILLLQKMSDWRSCCSLECISPWLLLLRNLGINCSQLPDPKQGLTIPSAILKTFFLHSEKHQIIRESKVFNSCYKYTVYCFMSRLAQLTPQPSRNSLSKLWTWFLLLPSYFSWQPFDSRVSNELNFLQDSQQSTQEVLTSVNNFLKVLRRTILAKKQQLDIHCSAETFILWLQNTPLKNFLPIIVKAAGVVIAGRIQKTVEPGSPS